MKNNAKIEVGDTVSSKTLEECELYNVVEDIVQIGSKPGDTAATISIMNKAGEYAGPAEDVRKFFDEHAIAPEMRTEDANVCTVGWSEKERKYYGWSHRATFGFGIGDKIYEPGFCFPDPHAMIPANERGTETIQTKEDARRSASNYAEDVS